MLPDCSKIQAAEEKLRAVRQRIYDRSIYGQILRGIMHHMLRCNMKLHDHQVSESAIYLILRDNFLEASPGIEPGCKDLQSSA